MTCQQCLFEFYGPTCYQNHLTKPLGKKFPVGTICQNRKICKECRIVVKSKKHPHRCGFHECPSCRHYVDIAHHQCYIQTEQQILARKRAKKNSTESIDDDDADDPPLFIFFDIECQQETGQHKPNLLVAQIQQQDTLYHFWGAECVSQFLEWLDSLTYTTDEEGDEQSQSLIVIAHNFKGYDSYFIIHECCNQKRQFEQLRVGAKILELRVGSSIIFRDSYAFLPMPLSAFPATFGITEQQKGFFPHLFNTPDRENYVGALPAAHYFCPETMNVKRKAEFETWYSRQLQSSSL